MQRAVERHVLDEVREPALVFILEHRAGVDGQPELGTGLGQPVLADVVAEAVRERADRNQRIDRNDLVERGGANRFGDRRRRHLLRAGQAQRGNNGGDKKHKPDASVINHELIRTRIRDVGHLLIVARGPYFPSWVGTNAPTGWLTPRPIRLKRRRAPPPRFERARSGVDTVPRPSTPPAASATALASATIRMATSRPLPSPGSDTAICAARLAFEHLVRWTREQKLVEYGDRLGRGLLPIRITARLLLQQLALGLSDGPVGPGHFERRQHAHDRDGDGPRPCARSLARSSSSLSPSASPSRRNSAASAAFRRLASISSRSRRANIRLPTCGRAFLPGSFRHRLLPYPHIELNLLHWHPAENKQPARFPVQIGIWRPSGIRSNCRRYSAWTNPSIGSGVGAARDDKSFVFTARRNI